MEFLFCLDNVVVSFDRQQRSGNSGSFSAESRSLTKTALAMPARIPGSNNALKKYLLAMKLTFVLITFGFLHLTAAGVSQTVTLSAKNCRIDSIFAMVKKQTGFVFFCSKDIINDVAPVSIDASDMELTLFLDRLFSGLPLKHSIKNKTIIVSRKLNLTTPGDIQGTKKQNEEGELLPPVTGIVRGRDGRILVGASVAVKGTKRGASTNAAGMFQLEVEPGQTLVISFIGYKKMEIRISARTGDLLDIVLVANDENIEEMVINTGIIKKDKTSFTGAVSVYTGAQLKTVGNKNILESLRMLDPSFIKVEDNLQGSNPNARPNFEIRGQTTINTNTVNDQFTQDPNQPLFILDGFETTLDMVRDMDMNRVATITILKDAASTALYGSRAANGVIVVETKRPVPGKLQMSYATDMTFEIPDLSSYNLMNAEEKLEFERLQGLYSTAGGNGWLNNIKYNRRLAEVRSGVNTYWLSEPVRMGLSHRQSLQFSGGNNDLAFNAGLSLAKDLGVMKGSSRNNWSGNIGINYRKGHLNVDNQLTVAGTTANESPYGNFADFANAIPYYRKTDPDGTIPKRLDPDFELAMMNPLYNASLARINETNAFSFFNNLGVMYSISNHLRAEGGLQVAKGNGHNTEFVPPEDTRFAALDLKRQGTYAYNTSESYSYSANMMLSYGEVLGKSQISAALRGDVSEDNSNRRGFTATGFPYGSDGNPMYAYGYTPFSVPTAISGKTRSAGFLVNLGYVWNQRFMLDATYRIDGATVFGSERIFKPFGSVGLGWNIHREPFMEGAGFVNLLKVRANAGYNGNENLGQFTSVSTFTFQTGTQNNFGQGIEIASLGNPFLDWQRTLQWSYGIDFGLWKSRVSGNIDYFVKETDPLTVGTEGILPLSVGISSDYMINVGRLVTKGWQVSLRVQPINNTSKRMVWTIGLTGAGSLSTYGGLADRLSKLDEEQTLNKGMLRFRDGNSPSDLWAVISRGVDPATGNELFQKKDGTTSFIYTTDDIVKIGNGRPKAEGRINTSFTFRELTIGTVLAYRIGGYTFNSALYNRVENISNARINLDKRALTSRWQQPGDITQFTNIKNTTANLSSRFIQEDNQIIGESINLSWRTYGKWLQQMKLQGLSVTLYLNDIFRLQKIKTERGINYPYARRASLTINVSF